LKTVKMFFVFIWSLLESLPRYYRGKKLMAAGDMQGVRQIVAEESVSWGRMLVEGTGSTVEVIGAENVPHDEAVVVVANHQGNFDIPVIVGYLGITTAFIAKEELRKFPVIGRWMVLQECVLIRRGNPREALKAISAGAELIRTGKSMVIFPEGSRSYSGRLLPFKPGSLKLAQKSGAAILPVTIINTCHIMPKKKLRIHSAQIKLIVGERIDPSKEQTTDLIERIHAEIEGNIQKYQTFLDD